MSEQTPVISGFFDEYRWLSNFWVEEDGKSAEHRFQAAKAESVEDYWYVMRAESPRMAKHRGRRVALRRDWEQQKVAVMLSVVRWKFRNEELAEKLRGTGSAVLIEANGWGDTFWGVDQETGIGENWLGRILMKVREEVGGERLDRFPWVDEEGERWSEAEESLRSRESDGASSEWGSTTGLTYSPRKVGAEVEA
jgi:ribA/ribD-fused uncharacterized protein